MKAELKQLSLEMGKREYNMLQGISNGENGFYNPACNVSYEEYRKWLKKEDDISKGINLPEGWSLSRKGEVSSCMGILVQARHISPSR